ncbi:unnamed protein product [Heligmosomoides polygyrus]|uniref:DUF5641 domain-containing protein n=1 Tax=Heligmosomoides polygyrus TaxID=6339 RepID=A0A183FHK6_HELPZ|nr:unnamed protein product [Heligmosomoides polygyrus]
MSTRDMHKETLMGLSALGFIAAFRRFIARREPTVGSVVLLQDQNSPRSQWKMGIIQELHPEEDNLVRAVSVRCSNGKVVKRSINLLIPLELHTSATSVSIEQKSKNQPQYYEQRKQPDRKAKKQVMSSNHSEKDDMEVTEEVTPAEQGDDVPAGVNRVVGETMSAVLRSMIADLSRKLDNSRQEAAIKEVRKICWNVLRNQRFTKRTFKKWSNYRTTPLFKKRHRKRRMVSVVNNRQNGSESL